MILWGIETSGMGAGAIPNVRNVPERTVHGHDTGLSSDRLGLLRERIEALK